MKKYIALLLVSLTFTHISCKNENSSSNSASESTSENALNPADQVHADVLKIFEATSAEDIDTIFLYTHPAIIKEMGGVTQAKTLMEMALGQLKALNTKIEKPTFPSELSFLKGTENEFVVVPIFTVMTMNGQRLESSNYQLGARKIGSAKWKYLDGNQLDKKILMRMLPDFPSDYKLPKSSVKTL